MLSFTAPPPPASPHRDEVNGAYVAETLGANEIVLANAHFHPLQWAAVSVLAIAVGWLVVPLVWIAPAIVRMATTEIAVTNQRLVLKTGWLGRTTNEMPLSAIENVEIHQNFIERLLGLGRLVVHGSGGGHWRTPSFAAPLTFRRAIEGAGVAGGTA
jgi:membrane protein YdbS with pleckstrin-like domain